MSAFWVLGSYYAAQCLMVMGVLRGAAIALKANRYPLLRAPERHPDA
jgi:hypothetical protein